MKDNETGRIEKRKSVHFYGWTIVGIAAVCMFFSGVGQTYAVSIFINAYIEDFGWSRSLVSGYYSVATLVAGLILPLVGKKIDKGGHRRMMTVISSLLGVACLWMSFVTRPAMLFVGLLFLRLFGQGSMMLLPSTLVPQWFVRNRGKALSFMAVGGVVGSGVLPPLNNWMVTSFGVSGTWRIWGVLLIGFMAPLGWYLVRNLPEDIGEIPDGVRSASLEKDDPKYMSRIPVREDSWTLKQAMTTKPFWFMLFCMVVSAMVNTGITFHIVSIMATKGNSSAFAALVLSIAAFVQFPLTFVAGYIVDRVKVRYVKSVSFGILLLAMTMLLYSESRSALILFAVVHGVFTVFDTVSTGVLWPNYFGRKNLGSIRGIAMTAMVVGSALGPLPFGYAFDLFQGYREILLVMMAFPVLASLASFLSPVPDYPREVVPEESAG